MITKEQISKHVEKIREILDDKDAADITIIDMEKTALMVDFFIIVTGNSDTHMAALRDYVIQYLKEQDLPIVNYDKGKGYDWMTIDAGSILVHIFSNEGREFYDLEGLWAEAERIQ